MITENGKKKTEQPIGESPAKFRETVPISGAEVASEILQQNLQRCQGNCLQQLGAVGTCEILRKKPNISGQGGPLHTKTSRYFERTQRHPKC
ncbi:hypothetical protein AVEN_9584-1 [Araneus ventricosus]|uniref:Uncharacterized protein n=1 Tax=Araneus ventricosus TaxID=182803 RepID=A0A4Y2H4U2_ARAVE|nr:hypothetical protein AVEN_9584-1 [Araneus ventricosus]